MFKRDLVARYGKATNYYVSDKEVRVALRERAIVYGGGGLLLVGGLITAAILAPEVFSGFLMLLAVAGAFGAAVFLFFYFTDRFPHQLKKIRDAKRHGVYEVDEH